MGYAAIYYVTPFTFEFYPKMFPHSTFNLSALARVYAAYIYFNTRGKTLSITQTGRINLINGEEDTTTYHQQLHILRIYGFNP